MSDIVEELRDWAHDERCKRLVPGLPEDLEKAAAEIERLRSRSADTPSPAREAAERIVQNCDKNGHVYDSMADEIEDAVTVARAYLAIMEPS